MIQHHLDDATLMAYAAGTLGEALSLVVASHLDICPKCRAELRQLELVGVALMGTIKAEPISVAGERAALARLEATDSEPDSAAVQGAAGVVVPTASNPAVAAGIRSDGVGPSDGIGLPRPLVGLVGATYDAIAWKRLAPGIKHYRLPLSAGAVGDLRLLHIEPGRQIPEHGHGASELTLVLAGSYSDATGRYSAGDVADLDSDIEHQPVVDLGSVCICLVASDQKARFKGLVSRILQPLIGM